MFIYKYCSKTLNLKKKKKSIIIQILVDATPKTETIDVTITGRSSKAIIVQHNSKKRHMTCSSTELLEELSKDLPSKKRITVESNIVTAYEK